jgi:hypothetical protein
MGLRLVAGRFPFKRTVFDLPLALFLLTAAVGVWAAYNREAAWAKFWLMAALVFVYYALAGQPAGNLWRIVDGLAVFGALLTAGFLLAYDWRAYPTETGFVNRLGEMWMSVRPTLRGFGFDPHVVSGVLALLLPLWIARVIDLVQRRRYGLAGLFSLATVWLLFGALLAARRLAWIGLGAALGLCLWGWLSEKLAGRLRVPPRALFIWVVMAVVVLGGVVMFAGAFDLVPLGRMPGLEEVLARLHLQREALSLSLDFPLTGGGLGAFPGLYTRYVLMIPWSFIPHAYSIVVNTMVEQGILGGLLALIVIAGGGWGMLRSVIQSAGESVPSLALLRWATLAAMAAIVVYGSAEDPFYDLGGAAMAFLPVAFSLALASAANSAAARRSIWADAIKRPWLRWSALGLAVLGILSALFFASPLVALAYANLGAVEMARVELAGWPEARWEEGKTAADFASADAHFRQALNLDSQQPIALGHLGLLALRQGDYEAAQLHLAAAYEHRPDSRVLRKALGYAHVWLNQPKEAARLLAGIPEAAGELETYAWWWGTQGREDMARYASEALAALQAFP